MDTNNKELNLSDVLAGIGRGIKNLFLACWKAFMWTVRYSIRHLPIVLIGLIIGIGAAFYTYRTHNAERSGFILNSYAKLPYTAIEFTNEFANHINVDMAEFLHVADTTAAQIKGIKAYQVVDRWHDNVIDFVDYKNKYSADTSLNTWSYNRFYVEVLTDDREIVPEVKDAIVNKLSENPVLRRLWDMEMINRQAWIDLYADEIAKIDSIQSKMYSAEPNPTLNATVKWGKDMHLVGENKVQIFSSDRSSALAAWAEHNRQMEALEQGVISSTLPIVYQGKIHSLPKLIVGFGILGIALAIGCSVFFQNRKKIKAYLTK